MKLICAKGGLKGHFTPKASLATQLYDRKVDEQLNQERTGHRSVQSVRQYKRTNENLQVSVSEALEDCILRKKAKESYKKNSTASSPSCGSSVGVLQVAQPSKSANGSVADAESTQAKLRGFWSRAQPGAFTGGTFNFNF